MKTISLYTKVYLTWLRVRNVRRMANRGKISWINRAFVIERAIHHGLGGGVIPRDIHGMIDDLQMAVDEFRKEAANNDDRETF